MDFKGIFRDANNTILIDALAAGDPGWVAMQDAVVANSEAGSEERINYVLAHAGIGIAILDILPTEPTSDTAGDRLGRFLATHGGPPVFGAPPRIARISLHHLQIGRLGEALAEAFPDTSAIAVPAAGESWVPALQDVLKATRVEVDPGRSTTASDHLPSPAADAWAQPQQRGAAARNTSFRSLYAFWGAVGLVAGSVAIVLSLLGSPPEHPSPRRGAERSSPVEPSEAPAWASAQDTAPPAGGQAEGSAGTAASDPADAFSGAPVASGPAGSAGPAMPGQASGTPEASSPSTLAAAAPDRPDTLAPTRDGVVAGLEPAPPGPNPAEGGPSAEGASAAATDPFVGAGPGEARYASALAAAGTEDEASDRAASPTGRSADDPDNADAAPQGAPDGGAPRPMAVATLPTPRPFGGGAASAPGVPPMPAPPDPGIEAGAVGPAPAPPEARAAERPGNAEEPRPLDAVESPPAETSAAAGSAPVEARPVDGAPAAADPANAGHAAGSPNGTLAFAVPPMPGADRVPAKVRPGPAPPGATAASNPTRCASVLRRALLESEIGPADRAFLRERCGTRH